MVEEKVCKTCSRVYRTEADFLVGTSRWRRCDLNFLWFNCSCQSTLVIVEGKYSWYKMENFLSPEASSIFNRLGGTVLPHLPVTVMRLLQTLEDKAADAKRIASIVKMEPFISSEILKIAQHMQKVRNPYDKPISTLEHAIVYVGQKSLKDLVVTASIKSLTLKTKKFDSVFFWNEAFLTATIAESLAKKFAPEISPDEAFLAGCLCNIGKIIGAILLPMQIDAVFDLTKSKDKPISWRKAERKMDLVSHCLLGEIGAVLWGLPEFVREPATLHHGYPDLKKKTSVGITHADIATFANQLTHWVSLHPEWLDESVLVKCREFFGISEKELDQFAESLMGLRKQFVAA